MARKPKQTIQQRAADAKARLELEEVQLKRAQIRHHKEVVKAKRAALSTYRAGERNRSNRDWRAPNVSADLAIIPDHSTVTARARQMVRDNDYAASIVSSFKRNVVGKGITPSFKSPDDVFNATMKGKWRRWARNKNLVDREKRRNFIQIQRWAAGELAEVGEALVVLSYEPRGRDVGLVLQCVEAEQLDTSVQVFEGNEVRGGVEVDQFGAAVAYHVYTRHPNDITGQYGQRTPWHRPDIRTPDSYDTREPHEKGTRSLYPESTRIPAYENGRPRVLHIYDPERVRQTRGISRLAPSLQRLRDLDQYDYAQLLAARAEACIGMVITSEPSGDGVVDGLLNDDADNLDKDGNNELAMQPFMTAHLNEGESVESFTPTRPGNLYDPFVTRQLRAVAAGAGVSYEQVARDFSTTNFSGLRQGQLEDRREWEPLQELLVCHLCQPVAEELVFWCVLEGKAHAPGYTTGPDKFNEVDWRGAGWEWVDPEKQAKGIQLMLDMGLTTKQIEANLLGRDWSELADQRDVEEGAEEPADQVEPPLKITEAAG